MMRKSKILFLTIVLSQIACYGQSTKIPVSLTTRSRDTLFLLDDGMGRAIAAAWMVPGQSIETKKPVLVFLSADRMLALSRKKRYVKPANSNSK